MGLAFFIFSLVNEAPEDNIRIICTINGNDNSKKDLTDNGKGGIWMQGYYWYLALLLISTVIVAITYWKSRNKLIIVFLFGVAGLIFQI
jgi:hypothetical protein